VILIGLGVAMVWGGYTMDRLEVRNIHPASIPGLVPMGLGALIAICGGLLFMTSRDDSSDLQIDLGHLGKLLWTGALCVTFALFLVGNVPFHVATFVFISAFTALFTYRKGEGLIANRRSLALALTSGVVFSALISILFRYAFLVRLP
ncbi:MAG: tripartite tricarboxylate transporter TctB family protein, partial [Rhizobiales bacterium]|nr:tripartite tricarboxylate transporter TctB family protein [Hyphomicrobiales bacterium]